MFVMQQWFLVNPDTLKDHMKSTATDGKMQQWFQEGLSGFVPTDSEKALALDTVVPGVQGSRKDGRTYRNGWPSS
ncbi:hypothetical protein RIF29_38812 [Crotalaria pallida]|uniref:Uncharacterized protein n=1 Tax=Crotalaria pallida TaxID=3830 RepID=A0AAN9E699_CROPI